MNKLFHPGNFRLSVNGGLQLNESGDKYFNAVTYLFPEQALGCPALRVSGSINELLKHLEKVIKLILNEKFTKLIRRSNISNDDIRKGFNQEYAEAEAKIAKT
jgi:hypothetical protein